jgi:hypothetical protein
LGDPTISKKRDLRLAQAFFEKNKKNFKKLLTESKKDDIICKVFCFTPDFSSKIGHLQLEEALKCSKKI